MTSATPAKRLAPPSPPPRRRLRRRCRVDREEVRSEKLERWVCRSTLRLPVQKESDGLGGVFCGDVDQEPVIGGDIVLLSVDQVRAAAPDSRLKQHQGNARLECGAFNFYWDRHQFSIR